MRISKSVRGLLKQHKGKGDLNVLFVMTEIVLPIMVRKDMRCTWCFYGFLFRASSIVLPLGLASDKTKKN